VTFSDPHVTRVDDHGLTLEGVPPGDAIAGGYDCAVITTHHAAFGYAAIGDGSPLVVDTRNALKGHTGRHIFRL
jgi:UDP-N-acetyl-D-mannosaminuronate dehydrogenase